MAKRPHQIKSWARLAITKSARSTKINPAIQIR